MDYVEMLPDNRFIVSEKRVNNSLFKEILKNGSISQIEKAIRERLSVGAKNTEQLINLTLANSPRRLSARCADCQSHKSGDLHGQATKLPGEIKWRNVQP